MHNNLGLSRKWDSVILHALSMIMFGSNHADAYCHMQHHKDPLGEDDHEGHCARMSFWGVLRYGPRFQYDLTKAALRNGSSMWQRKIIIDWALIVFFATIIVVFGPNFLKLHLLAMLVGQMTVAFFAVWITHQATEEEGIAGRSQRGPIAWIAYLMFYHREHHLFPRVPVSRLPELAARLDKDVPNYAASRKPVIRLWDK